MYCEVRAMGCHDNVEGVTIMFPIKILSALASRQLPRIAGFGEARRNGYRCTTVRGLCDYLKNIEFVEFIPLELFHGHGRRVRLHHWLLAVASVLVGVPASFAQQLLPRPDHVVIVIEENHSYDHILVSPGPAAAPYINQLAAQGASFTNSHGLLHPSQGNYLDLFSGDNQGVTEDGRPSNLPFNTPN